MTVAFELTPEDEALLRKLAAAARMDEAAFAREALLEKLHVPSWSDALDPVRKAVGDANITDDELDQMIERGRAEVWQERQGW